MYLRILVFLLCAKIELTQTSSCDIRASKCALSQQTVSINKRSFIHIEANSIRHHATPARAGAEQKSRTKVCSCLANCAWFIFLFSLFIFSSTYPWLLICSLSCAINPSPYQHQMHHNILLPTLLSRLDLLRLTFAPSFAGYVCLLLGTLRRRNFSVGLPIGHAVRQRCRYAGIQYAMRLGGVQLQGRWLCGLLGLGSQKCFVVFASYVARHKVSVSRFC